MEEWKEYKLGDIIELSSGGTPNKDNQSFWGGGIPWISAKSMYDDFLSTSDLYITQEGLENGSKLAKKGSILLLTRGSGLFNRIPVCYVCKDLAYNQDVKNIYIKDESITSNEFMFYWLYGNKALITSILETTGIGAGKIDTKRLLGLTCFLPSKDEQARMCSLAKCIMDKIEVNRRINDNLEQQAQALFKSWFVDFEPFRDQPFVESEMGQIPQGWKVGTLAGITLQKSTKVGQQENVKVLSPVTTGKLMLSEDYFTKQVFSESIAKYKIVEIGDFAYNPARVNIGSIGRNEYDFRGCVSPVYVVFSCKEGYAYYFDLFRKTEKFQTEVKARAIGGVRQSLNYTDFGFIQTIIAPDDVMYAFNPLYTRIITTQKHLDEENTHLASLRDALLPRLMSGELKVNEIENSI